MTDRLRGLWNFDDLDGTEQCLHAQLDQETTDSGRAELLTQLARVEGLRQSFDEGEELIGQAEALAGDSVPARIRIDLERGRLLRSGGDAIAAMPLFETEDVKTGLASAVNALKAGKPRPVLDFKGR